MWWYLLLVLVVLRQVDVDDVELAVGTSHTLDLFYLIII